MHNQKLFVLPRLTPQFLRPLFPTNVDTRSQRDSSMPHLRKRSRSSQLEHSGFSCSSILLWPPWHADPVGTCVEKCSSGSLLRASECYCPFHYRKLIDCLLG